MQNLIRIFSLIITGLVITETLASEQKYYTYKIHKTFSYVDLTGRVVNNDLLPELMTITRDQLGNVRTITKEIVPPTRWQVTNYYWTEEVRDEYYKAFLATFDRQRRVYSFPEWSIWELQSIVLNFINYTSGHYSVTSLEQCFVVKSLDFTKVPMKLNEITYICETIVLPYIDKSPRKWTEYDFDD